MHCNIIPVKSLINSKQRLNSFLTPEEREKLVHALLQDVLTAATNSKLAHCTLLITSDSKIVKITQQWHLPNLEYLIEPKEKGINYAVQFALEWCLSKSVSSILIIPADIPLITAEDIDDLIKLAQEKSSIVIAPSQRKDGTNAFYQQPPNLFQVWYGPDSFRKNLNLILKKHLPYHILEHPAFALDIDLKEDLIHLQQMNSNTYTSKFVKNLNI
jgi:2-phospho-L-lactate guanylyltransferase